MPLATLYDKSKKQPVAASKVSKKKGKQKSKQKGKQYRG